MPFSAFAIHLPWLVQVRLPVWTKAFSRVILCWYAGVGLADAASAAIEDRKWSLFESQHFQVYSDRRAKEVAAQIQNLELFQSVVMRLTGIDPNTRFDHPTKIFMLRSSSNISKLFKIKRAAGFMRPGVRYNLLVVGNDKGTLAGENEIAFHEYVHYLVRNASAFQYPAWYSEGMADVLSTVRRDDDKVVVGDIPVARAYSWLNDKRMHLRRILNTRSTWSLKRRAVPRFYAGSWLFTHYLIFSGDSREHQFVKKNQDYLNRLNAGEDREVAFEASFGMSVDDMNKRVRDYAGDGLPAFQLPVDRFSFDDSYTERRLPRAEIAYELGYAIVEANPSTARRMFKKILEDEPDNLRALAGLGVSYQMESDFTQAKTLIHKAMQGNPKDYLLHIEYADVIDIACRRKHKMPACPEADVHAEVTAHYAKAHELAPHLLETNSGYAYHLLTADQPEKAIPLYEVAVGLLPSYYTSTRWLGVAHLRAGNHGDAEKYLNTALGWSVDNPLENQAIQNLLQELELQREQAAVENASE